MDNVTGKVSFTEQIRNRIYNKEEGFREKLILEINSFVQGRDLFCSRKFAFFGGAFRCITTINTGRYDHGRNGIAFYIDER
jgi:hypothetical protein